MLTKIPPFAKNFYFLATLFFVLWMLFFDASDFVTQFKLSKTKRDLLAEKEYYLNKIEEVKEERKELMSNPKLLEKFARERYLMKKPSEDIYIVIDEKYDE